MSRILFSGAHLLDGENPGRAGQTVAIEDGQIVAVGPDASIPRRPGDQEFGLDGASVMPGMVQAHWHGSYRDLGFDPPPVAAPITLVKPCSRASFAWWAANNIK